MINLLPPKEKDRIILKEKERLAVIMGFLVLYFIICFLLIILSINFLLDGKLSQQKYSLENLRHSLKESETEDIQKGFNSFNESVDKLNLFYNQKVYFYNVLLKISDIIPKDAVLDNVSLNIIVQEQNSKVLASLSGFIKSRESLFEFKESLEKEQLIKNVSFPPSNWVSQENINFFVSFVILKQNEEK